MRVDQFLINLSIDGAPMGIWDSWSGGARTATGTRYRPGGMRKPVSLGGSASTENVTVGRLVYKESGDWDILVRLKETRVGKAIVEGSRRPMDDDGNPYGATERVRGTLISLTPPDSNSNEDGEAIWTIEIEPEG